jgi:tripartite-type tricarboxylate transporter receptor subunit TctC
MELRMKLRMTGILAGVVLGSLLSSAAAQGYPSKPVKIVVPANPATSLDAFARTVAHDLSARLGQTVFVENMPGAGGNIASVNVARAAPDGYTLVMQITSFVVNPSLYKKTSYDPIRQFQPVILGAWSAPTMLVVSPSIQGVGSVKDLVALSKARPGQLNYASPGFGTPQHLAMELFKRMSGADFTHVPFKTPGDMVKAVLSGDVTAIFASANVAIPQARAGKLKLVAVTGNQRWLHSPEVPTMAESGFPEFKFDIWFGFLAPAGTPEEIVRKLNAGFAAGLKTQALKESLSKQGLVATSSTPEEFAELIRKDLAHWARVIKDTGISID